VEEITVRLRAVAAGTSCFLVIRLERSWHRVMHDQAHVALVDPHAECVCGDDAAHALGHERFLHVLPVRIVEAGVIGGGLHAGARQMVRHTLDGFTRCRIDDRHTWVLLQQFDERAVLFGIVLRANHMPTKIRPVEPGEDNFRVAQFEHAGDIAANFGRRRRGERDRRRSTQACVDLADPPVARTEVVPPLRNTVRFVDREQRDTDGGDALGRVSVIEPLRRDVQQLDLAALHTPQARRHFIRGQRTVDERRRNAARLERVDLVLHETDQWREDDRQSVEEERRYLIADRLTAARRENDERVASGEHRRDGPLLPRPEIGVAKAFAEEFARGFERRRGHGEG
jgi:hypothetical protein